jgi:hypothetical protein
MAVLSKPIREYARLDELYEILSKYLAEQLREAEEEEQAEQQHDAGSKIYNYADNEAAMHANFSYDLDYLNQALYNRAQMLYEHLIVTEENPDVASALMPDQRVRYKEGIKKHIDEVMVHADDIKKMRDEAELKATRVQRESDLAAEREKKKKTFTDDSFCEVECLLGQKKDEGREELWKLAKEELYRLEPELPEIKFRWDEHVPAEGSGSRGK